LPQQADPDRRILLVDCDAFFVQVARLEDPTGAGRAPLLIVGGSASGRGVVTSASYEARAFGVRSAMPTARAVELCPDAMVVPVPREACMLRSRAVRSALEELAPVVEAASIDEFYLDLGGTERLFRGEDLETSARRIREEVLARTGISVSIGGGTRRLIAKLASRYAKPAGVHIVPPGREEAFMRRLDLADIPGVGPSLLALLHDKGLVRVEDALSVDPEWLRRWLGPHRGAWLYHRLRGRDATEVDPRERRKSVSSARTFPRDIDDDEELRSRLLGLCDAVGRALRNRGLRARTVTVKLRDADFRTRSRSRTVPRAVESDAALFRIARELLDDLRRARATPARLLGVGASALVTGQEPEQLGLFPGPAAAEENERDRKVSRTVDDLRRRFGRKAILPGRMLDASSEPEPPT